ncbi:MAG: PhoH family protein [Bifidobacteriaceae bacterium]|jgi:phosphate starvation-inducible PhoH-like protein|nr:PhoH family protein [Bifidobacteriaceae bacterium]
MFSLLGREDATLRAIEALVPQADIHVRGDRVTLRGRPRPVEAAAELVAELIAVIERGGQVGPEDARRVFAMLNDAQIGDHAGTGLPAPSSVSTGRPRPAEILSQSILSSRGRTVRPKTLGQKRYVDAIDQNTVTFGIGPAGTGKTYLAMAKAVQALQAKRVKRIVLTRPAVEAGERLGFLPGTLNEKIDPYLRPLYDALQDMIDTDSIPRLMEAGTIEVAPLAYMRGRTLNDAFIILDEAQNTSSEQMKMFLTRLGFGAKMVVTGDVTQTDLPGSARSGLLQVRGILRGIDDLEFCELTSKDVVRHRLVSEIIDAYARGAEGNRS